MTAFTITLEPIGTLTDEAFYQLCRANPDVKFERSSQGELIIMSPTGGESGRRNADITIDLGIWNRQTKLGYTFDSSTCFKLPNGAERSPDAAWIECSRWHALSPDAREKFPPIAPDFVIELRSASDRLTTLQTKMEEYRANGVQLGWLINPQNQTVEIYRPGQAVEVLQAPQQIDGEDVLPSFVLNLKAIWG
ncbi:Uma2 family endonuclease [Leptolyngbya cf. ectocarpi LEGE 11479]|uniref:Uma2 family endonuclease n=1 Tax=Leptolyngbya cf. ectocarpi LEGE 11479 TaxID=1828722 RepID=A0A929A022_LEPEC|nr:Uma2 family endonuclease [Leptolyngbya ectocarpi]MBE9070561.1 Uma2 family endonuclease [Leptolyngbya cf. ectocarpi LEGE 11479]